MAIPTSSPSLDWDAAKSHIENVENYLKEFAGKPEHNPFTWHAMNVSPLKDRLERGEKTPELHAAIMGLKKTPPLAKVPTIEGVTTPSKTLTESSKSPQS